VVTFKHILCPIDLSESSAAPLGYAVAVARRYKSELTVLHVVPTFDAVQFQSGQLGDPVRLVPAVPREEVLAELLRVLDTAGGATLGARLNAEAGDPVATIMEQAVAMPADLLVMGTHGRSGFERFVLGSVAEKLLRKALCPTLTVPPHAAHVGHAGAQFDRILCAMDFSPAALQALGFALDLAHQAKTVVTVLHVVEWLAEDQPGAYPYLNVEELQQRLTEDAEAQMRPLVAEAAGPQREFVPLVRMGRAHREIVQAAESIDANLIVMGAQGRGDTGLRVFGSTAQQVVRTATCPVLTVRG
jgi:nucleotide-binding universal stress UspA family protein